MASSRGAGGKKSPGSAKKKAGPGSRKPAAPRRAPAAAAKKAEPAKKAAPSGGKSGAAKSDGSSKAKKAAAPKGSQAAAKKPAPTKESASTAKPKSAAKKPATSGGKKSAAVEKASASRKPGPGKPAAKPASGAAPRPGTKPAAGKKSGAATGAAASGKSAGGKKARPGGDDAASTKSATASASKAAESKAATDAKPQTSGRSRSEGSEGGGLTIDVPRKKGDGSISATTSGAAKKGDRAAANAQVGDGESGKYVYCIIQSRETPVFGPIGIGNEPAEVHTVNYKDIAAVVSDTPIEVYDPTRENVLAHERVNETVMRDHTVIPMSFGTVFKTGDDIVELLRSAYEAFRDVLQKMQNKLEFGLKVLWDPDDIIREVEKEDENLRRLRVEMSTRRSSTYFARMQYGRLVDSLLQDRCDLYIRDIFAALRGVSVASRANKCIGDRMIMNAAFLVARDQETEFDATVKEIGARHHHLTFKYTGPWPPYNFVNIRLKLERAKEA